MTRKMAAEPPPTGDRRKRPGGRRPWDMPPNLTKVLIAWAVTGPSAIAALVALAASR